MKRLSTLTLGIAFLAFVASSCSEENIYEMTSGDEVIVTITTQIPVEVSTRSYGNGSSVDILYYAVYETGATSPAVKDTATVSDLTATLELTLVSGISYEMIFWAQNSSAECYTIDYGNKTVSVDYGTAVCNDETRDAFFGYTTIDQVSGPVTKSVSLTRPFAQINIGTDDLGDESVSSYVSGMTSEIEIEAQKIYQTLSLTDGAVSHLTDADVTFAEAAIPSGDSDTYPVTGYDYLAMCYVLVGEDVVPANVNLTVRSTGVEADISASNVSLQRNYCSNIYGSLLKDKLTTSHLAYIDDTGYSSLQEAINAAAEGDKITLTDDVTMTGNITIASGKKVSIDLGGHTLTNDGQNGYNIGVYVASGGELTSLTNGSIVAPVYGIYMPDSGTIGELNVNVRVGAGTGSGNAIAVFILGGSTITKITGGTYESYEDEYTTGVTMSPCIYVWNGSIGEISGGTFVSRGNTLRIATDGNSSIGLISGGTFISAYISDLSYAYSDEELSGGICWNKKYGPDKVTGGVYYNLVESVSYSAGITNNIEEGYKLQQTDVLAASSYLVYNAKDDSSNTAYYTVSDTVVNEYYFWEVVESE